MLCGAVHRVHVARLYRHLSDAVHRAVWFVHAHSKAVRGFGDACHSIPSGANHRANGAGRSRRSGLGGRSWS